MWNLCEVTEEIHGNILQIKQITRLIFKPESRGYESELLTTQSDFVRQFFFSAKCWQKLKIPICLIFMNFYRIFVISKDYECLSVCVCFPTATETFAS